jgi:hypothetical protein
MTIFYAILLAILEVSATGYYCKKHIITRAGDKCSYIWDKNSNKEYFVRRIDFLRINPSIDCDNLKEGTSICVEIDASKSEKKNSFDEYISKKNDTCEKIAKKTNSSINALLNVNNNLKCEKIIPGTYIEYHKDGNYTPDFKNSKEVPVDPKQTTTSVKKITKTTTKKVTKTTKLSNGSNKKIVKVVKVVKTKTTKRQIKSRK